MRLNLFHVDAFTDAPFAGNPAAVCLLEGPADEGWMQSVAREMNLSETAFLHREGDGFHLRWFTPAVEVELCGHATLASAHVLWEQGWLAPDVPARFFTRSGTLLAARRGRLIELDFPALPAEAMDELSGLAPALGAEVLSVGKSRFDYIAEVADEEALRGLQPDMRWLAALGSRGVIVTCAGKGGPYDFLSRYFAPGAGIDEDPVTGSAHCCLGPFWGARLGKEQMVGFQASARGGVLHVRLAGERVFIGGQAVTVARGILAV